MGSSHIDGLVYDSSTSIANALEFLQFCTQPSIYDLSIPDGRYIDVFQINARL